MSRILIVDNEVPVRVMLADMLRGTGYNVSVARSGFEAIEMIPAIKPDLVMLDVNMPGFDGWATLKHLRAEFRDTRVLMMSGADHQRQALELGAVAFLDKPYRHADVLRVVASCLGEQPGQPARAA